MVSKLDLKYIPVNDESIQLSNKKENKQIKTNFAMFSLLFQFVESMKHYFCCFIRSFVCL